MLVAKSPRPKARPHLQTMEECAIAVQPIPQVQHMASAADLSDARAAVPALVFMDDPHLSTLLALRSSPITDILKTGPTYESLLERLQVRKLHLDDFGTIVAVDDAAPTGTDSKIRLRAPVETRGRDALAWLGALQLAIPGNVREHDARELDISVRTKELLPVMPDLDMLDVKPRKPWTKPVVKRFTPERVLSEIEAEAAEAARKKANPTAAAALSAEERAMLLNATKWRARADALGVLDQPTNNTRARAMLHAEVWRHGFGDVRAGARSAAAPRVWDPRTALDATSPARLDERLAALASRFPQEDHATLHAALTKFGKYAVQELARLEGASPAARAAILPPLTPRVRAPPTPREDHEQEQEQGASPASEPPSDPQ